MGIVGVWPVAVAAAFLLGMPAQAATPTSLVRPLAGAEVDWSAGTVTASAGAAADMRLPSADAARPGAERRARAAATEKLRAALRLLPMRREARLGELEIKAALGHASIARIEYQSNGGVVLWMQVRFEDLGMSASNASAQAVATEGPARQPAHVAPGAIPIILAVGAMELEVAPMLLADGREIVARSVRYRQGKAPADAVNVRRDERGRLLPAQGGGLQPERLAEGPIVIYLQKVLP